MSESITYTVTMRRVECPTCGIVFAVPEDWFDRKVEAEAEFHCPNGHQDFAYTKSDSWAADVAKIAKLTDGNSRMKGELARALHRLDQLDAAERDGVPAPPAEATAEPKPDVPPDKPATIAEACWVAARGEYVCGNCKAAYRGLGWFARHLRVAHDQDAKTTLNAETVAKWRAAVEA